MDAPLLLLRCRRKCYNSDASVEVKVSYFLVDILSQENSVVVDTPKDIESVDVIAIEIFKDGENLSDEPRAKDGEYQRDRDEESVELNKREKRHIE